MQTAWAVRTELKKRGWFRSQPPGLQQAIIEGASWREYGHGEFLFGPKQNERWLYGVVSGMVKYSYLTPDGNEYLGAVFYPGDWFNLIAVLDEEVLPHAAYVVGSSCVLGLPAEAYDALTEAEPRYYRNFARISSANFRETAMRLVDIKVLSAEQRVAKLLLQIDGTLRPLDSTCNGFLHITQEELCQLLLLARSTLGKVLASFSRAGWISQRYSRIRVDRPEELRKILGSEEAPASDLERGRSARDPRP